MRSFVTGAAGFIGSHLVDRLLAEGQQVVAIDNMQTGSRANLDNAFRYNEGRAGRFTFLELDVQAPELSGVVAGANPDVIYHLAAQVDPRRSVLDPQFDARSNVLGTINLCEASRRGGVRRIVYATSGECRYGLLGPMEPVDFGHTDPQSPYVVGKLAGEMYLRAYAQMYDLRPICLALPEVYGPRQRLCGGGVVTVFGNSLITGAPLGTYRSSGVDEYLYVDDVVEAFLCAGGAAMSLTGTYDIRTGRHISVPELHARICAALDEAPLQSVRVTGDDDLPGGEFCCSETCEDLDWRPAVDITEGIRRTMQWLRATLEPELPALVSA
ncbi:NAD-dependent epimerase/dehydratase family protein [Mycolicibacterium litorale]|uniref:UDP-glucose 4-epimerase n=1 Tax=Mycolicibacterium litorale TaxID=758802 RepID=A0AAD1IX15_9MYCO|nr:NAD-dependent epimerase/dehydratase family protein [Mycolicibacterium litorale]MCV7418110.1 NAD-dependent epimerase/dehydratase family protein [Mycolicibacterium litorale]TDY06502.1 UDP-glucose 4-epimerase [Mycolicibacterium litorale]BBY19353.1 UDP-glucose 4-epimerase [Mycolicibacterium litorale]